MFFFHKYKKFLFFIGVIVVTFSTPIVSWSAPNFGMNYQGKLTDTSDSAVADGMYHMKFRLYTVETGGTDLWGRQ